MTRTSFDIVRSEFKKSRLSVVIISTIFFAVLTLSATAVFLRKQYGRSLHTGEAWFTVFMIIILLFVTLVMYLQIHRDARRIEIDALTKTITSTNLFNRNARQYALDSLDGYVDMIQKGKYGDYRVIYLVKDKRYILKISAFYYNNMEEMENALHRVKFLGRKEFSFRRSIAILRGRPVD